MLLTFQAKWLGGGFALFMFTATSWQWMGQKTCEKTGGVVGEAELLQRLSAELIERIMTLDPQQAIARFRLVGGKKKGGDKKNERWLLDSKNQVFWITREFLTFSNLVLGSRKGFITERYQESQPGGEKIARAFLFWLFFGSFPHQSQIRHQAWIAQACEEGISGLVRNTLGVAWFEKTWASTGGFPLSLESQGHLGPKLCEFRCWAAAGDKGAKKILWTWAAVLVVYPLYL